MGTEKSKAGVAIFETIMQVKRIHLFIILILYASIVLFGVYNHEPWRDEGHAWVIAREDSVMEMVRNQHVAPASVLWLVILSPFARLGFPYVTMNLVHAMIAIAAVWLLLFRSKLPILTKILFIFSYYMAYEYAIIARNYVTAIAALFIVAAIYRDRFSKPILYGFTLLLSFQSNLVFNLIPTGFLVILYASELFLKRLMSTKRLIGLGIMVISAIITVVMIIPAPCCRDQHPPDNPMQIAPIVFRNAILPSFPTLQNIAMNSTLFSIAVIVLTAVMFVSFMVMVWRNKILRWLSIAFFGWLLYANMFLHTGTLRHHGLLLIATIFLWWIFEDTQRVVTGFQRISRKVFISDISILLAGSLFFTVYIYTSDFQYNFSGAKDMAQYIYTHHLEKFPMVLYASSDGVAIIPYFPHKLFWYPQFESFGAYHFYNPILAPIRHSDTEGLKDAIDLYVQKNAPALILLSTPLYGEGTNTYTLLHASFMKWFWSNDTENFWLYARTADLTKSSL